MWRRWKNQIALPFFFPVAALLVWASLDKAGVPEMPWFGRDWRFVFGGPAGIAATVGVRHAFEPSWILIGASYLMGVIACAAAVLLLEVLIPPSEQ